MAISGRRGLTQGAKRLLKRNPRLWLQLRDIVHRVTGRSEPELKLLDRLVDPSRMALDVGANVGAYSYRLSKLCGRVIAFEANRDLAAELTALMPANVAVVHGAVSDHNGVATLRIPRTGPFATGLGTVESANTLGNAAEETAQVPCFTLDSRRLSPVGFIKIDVEGHELAVLRGAQTMLRADRPSILVEAEERHRPGAVQSIVELLKPLGYQGFMLRPDGRPADIASFVSDRDQGLKPADLDALDRGHAPSGYISNFFFVPEEQAAPWRVPSDGVEGSGQDAAPR